MDDGCRSRRLRKYATPSGLPADVYISRSTSKTMEGDNV